MDKGRIHKTQRATMTSTQKMSFVRSQTRSIQAVP